MLQLYDSYNCEQSEPVSSCHLRFSSGYICATDKFVKHVAHSAQTNGTRAHALIAVNACPSCSASAL